MPNLDTPFLNNACEFFERINDVEVVGEKDFSFQQSSANDILSFLFSIEVIIKNNQIIEQKDLVSINPDKFNLKQLFLILHLKKNKDKYPWLRRAYLGRQVITDTLREGGTEYENILSCLRESKLIGEFSDDNAEKWWTRLSGFSRDISDERLQEIGRKGEQLSFCYEEMRHAPKEIEKTYIENTGAGYDILSWKDASEERLCIEVKTTERGVDNPEASIYLTRNEWKKANEISNYIFHIWDVKKINSPLLAIVDKANLLSHIPKNLGQGEWETVKIKVAPFKKDFLLVN
tara:strand:- start:2443 stop:3312 length:870 start_codon:yes stop_codon:yes gene_type:complete